MAVTAILTIAAAVVSAMGQMAAANNAKAIADRNAEAGFQKAHAERLRGIEERKRTGRQVLLAQGRNIAYGGATEKMDLLEDNELEGALMGADVTAQAETRAVYAENGAQIQIAQGNAAVEAGQFGAAASLLKGTASAYDSGGGNFGIKSKPTTVL